MKSIDCWWDLAVVGSAVFQIMTMGQPRIVYSGVIYVKEGLLDVRCQPGMGEDFNYIDCNELLNVFLWISILRQFAKKAFLRQPKGTWVLTRNDQKPPLIKHRGVTHVLSLSVNRKARATP